jgi:hypothetical protein
VKTVTVVAIVDHYLTLNYWLMRAIDVEAYAMPLPDVSRLSVSLLLFLLFSFSFLSLDSLLINALS